MRKLALALPSVPEIRYLIGRLLLSRIVYPAFVLAWSAWRRHHQAAAAAAHYRIRAHGQL